MNYEELLEKAYKEIKPIISKSERFEPPKTKIIIEGNKTIITNFQAICSYLRRDPSHFAKFLLRELATPGEIDGERLILNRKILTSSIDEKIQMYIQKFVICPECKKPDTEIQTKDKISFMYCLACGARHSVS